MDKYVKKDMVDRLREIATDDLLKEEIQPEIIKLRNPYPFKNIKSLIRERYQEYGEIHFLINTNTRIKGKVTHRINDFKNRISLIKVVEQHLEDEETGEDIKVRSLCFFNEKIDRRKTIAYSFDADFYIYKMVSNEREYLLFSRESLELKEYTIEGMQVEMSDMADIGNYTRINLMLPVLFVNQARERIIRFKSPEALFKVLPAFTEDKLMSYLLSGEEGTYFPHPRYFERLIAAFLFSARYDTSPYPLHLLIIGPPGSGKSKVMECLHGKFEENNEITDGSCSTIKSLIPSFKSTITIQTGDLIKSNRICCVDEFLRILVRIPSEEREPQLAALNPLLEHKVRNFGSGNYSFKGVMTAKMITASNPVYGTSDMIRLTNKIDKSFISRLLVYYQDSRHFKTVAEKDETQLRKTSLEMEKELFVSLYDYLGSFQSEFDKGNVNAIYEEGLRKLGEDEESNELVDVRSIYLARYKHHLYCLMDGIVKLRCLCERDVSFQAKRKDFERVREIWNKIIDNMDIRLRGVLNKQREL